MSLSRQELRLLQQPDGIVRLFWKRLYRHLRIKARTEAAIFVALHPDGR